MNHLYSVSKSGDQLCPLGFHPQVRWPTRCKRCFRDYKEHGMRRGDDIAASTPSLNRDAFDKTVRSWTSTSNLSSQDNNVIEVTAPLRIRQRPSSWSSTPDLDEAHKAPKLPPKPNEEIVVNVQIPVRRRNTTNLEPTVEESFTLKRPPRSPSRSPVPTQQPQQQEPTVVQPIPQKPSPPVVEETIIINKTDSLAERVRKMQIIKRQGSLERELGSSSREGSVPRSENQSSSSMKKQESDSQPIRRRRQTDPLPPIPDDKPATRSRTDLPPIPTKGRSDLPPVPDVKPKSSIKKQLPISKTSSDSYASTSKDIQFLMQIKDSKIKSNASKLDDDVSTTTETTETTLIDRKDSELREENEMLRREIEVIKARCERAERDKSDILLRRLASMDTTSNKTAAAEALKLQQKVNEMKQQIEDLQDEKKSLSQKVKELTAKSSSSIEETLRAKLEQAERMCEALMDENEEIKREVKNMESEMDELQDNFREEQADEYVSIKKELEQTTKNCRILSFKLKKSERKIEQLELEKQSMENNSNSEMATKIKQLEDELKVANEVARRLQSESEQAADSKKKAPALGKIGKSTSDGGANGKVSRASLTRGGSQEDPVQLLRDLQDSAERETDLREQLKFAEEESESLRKKCSRIEEENESLIMQLKKMATKAKTRKPSLNPSRHNDVEKDEGISDEEDTAELKLQLELNEQETAVLRRKVEDLEKESESNKRQIEQLQERLANDKKNSLSKKFGLNSKSEINDPLKDKKVQVMEDEINELRKKIIEKDREFDRVQAELSLTKGKTKTGILKTKTPESPAAEAQNIDLKRQLQVVEQEASVLRGKTQTLEQENDKLLAEIKKLQLQVARSSLKGASPSTNGNKESEKLKSTIEELEKERDELKSKIKSLTEGPINLPARTPKVYSDTKTKLQLKKMIEELEDEITELRVLASKAGGGDLKKLQEDNKSLKEELSALQKRFAETSNEIESKKSTSTLQVKELETKLQKMETENKSFIDKIKNLEDKLSKQESSYKQMETTKSSFELQLKGEKSKISKIEKELDKVKIERAKWETKAQAVETELAISKKSSEKAKQEFEEEIKTLKSKSVNNEFPSRRLQELQDQTKDLEENLEKEYKKYSALNGKYELLEEEHVLIKAQLTTEKEKLENEIKTLKSKIKDFESYEDTFKQERLTLGKKIADLQKKLTEAEHSPSKISTTSAELEKSRLKAKLEEKESEYDKLMKQHEMVEDQLQVMRKENDDIRKKLDDFERINKAQRTLNDHNITLENELKKLKAKLEASEMAVKAEVASTRLRYETQINTLQNELTSVHRQVDRFKKDRDSYKQLLEAAQKNIGELKQNRKSYTSTSSGDEDDKSKIQYLEQQVGCLEDELSESRLEASKLRTEMISEKSAFEIKISEMQSKMNEYEEERILSSSKVPGTKSRLELTWQKEREEQQRLLSETSTLARDLRQTLFEVERERDKERLESRRKVEQIKKATEEELEEGRRKISELQSDLLELRDAHAKLRTANEKLRRDRDRSERERESGSSNKRRLEQVGEKKVGALLQTVDELVKIAPDLQNLSKDAAANTSLSIPNPPRRSKSRSPSPTPSSASTMQISTVLARLAEASDELRRYQRLCDEEREREKARRSGMRRAASQENDNGLEVNTSRPVTRLNRSSHGSLYRKSLSLDQSMQAEQQQQIWKDSDVGSMSSVQSIDSEYGIRRGDSSIDSRISIGSTQSDMPGRRKKKKGIMGKLRSLTKGSRGTESDISQHGSDSDLSVTGDHRSSKKDLKERISGMFKRSGSTSRSGSRAGSQEKILNDSQARPISIATSTTNGSSSTLPPNFSLQQIQTQPKTKPPTPTGQRRVRPVSTSTLPRSKS